MSTEDHNHNFKQQLISNKLTLLFNGDIQDIVITFEAPNVFVVNRQTGFGYNKREKKGRSKQTTQSSSVSKTFTEGGIIVFESIYEFCKEKRKTENIHLIG